MAIICLLKASLVWCCILSLSVVSHPMWRFSAQKSAVDTLHSSELRELNVAQSIGRKSSTDQTLVIPTRTRRKSFLSRCTSNMSCINPKTVSTTQSKLKIPSKSTDSPVKNWYLLDSPVYSRSTTTKKPEKEKEVTEDEWYHLIKDQETSTTLEVFTPCLFKLSETLSVAEIPDKFKAELSAALEKRWVKTETSQMEKSVIELIYDMAKNRIYGIREVVRKSLGSIRAILDKFSITSDEEAKKDLKIILEIFMGLWHNVEDNMNIEQMTSHGGLFEEWNTAGQVIVNCFKLLTSSCLVPGEFCKNGIEHEISLLEKRLGNPVILLFFYNLTKDLMKKPQDSRLEYYNWKRDEFLKELQRASNIRSTAESALRRTYALQKDLRNMLMHLDDEDPIFPVGIHASVEFFEEEDEAPEVHADTFRTLRSISMPTNTRNSPSSST